MRLTSALLLLAAGSALAQTTTKPAVHHTTTPAHKPTTSTCPGLPSLGASITKLPGCPKPLYALQSIDTLVGTGPTVSPRKWLTVNYTGYLLDGTKFDSSIGTTPDGKPKEPITFPYGAHQVITGWDTGFEGMNVGGKRRLFIPYQLAYGELGRPPVIPAKAQLVFDLELVGISDTPPAPKTPPAPSVPAGGQSPPAGQTPLPAGTAPANSAAPNSAIPPTTAPPASQPAAPPPTDPTKPTAIPPTTAPPATSPKPNPPVFI